MGGAGAGIQREHRAMGKRWSQDWRGQGLWGVHRGRLGAWPLPITPPPPQKVRLARIRLAKSGTTKAFLQYKHSNDLEVCMALHGAGTLLCRLCPGNGTSWIGNWGPGMGNGDPLHSLARGKWGSSQRLAHDCGIPLHGEQFFAQPHIGNGAPCTSLTQENRIPCTPLAPAPQSLLPLLPYGGYPSVRPLPHPQELDGHPQAPGLRTCSAFELQHHHLLHCLEKTTVS